MKNLSVAVIGDAENRADLKRLERLGYELIHVPAAGLRPVDLSRDDLADLLSPEEFDWVIFCDEYAVERLQLLAGKADRDLFGYDQPQIVALGEPVADRLRFIQLHADLIPTKIDRRPVFDSIALYAGGADALTGVSFLVVSSVKSGRVPTVALAEAGATVKSLQLCELDPPSGPTLTKLKALVVGGGIDLVFFSSSKDVLQCEVLASHGLDLLAGGADACCSDEVTRAALYEAGIEAKLI